MPRLPLAQSCVGQHGQADDAQLAPEECVQLPLHGPLRSHPDALARAMDRSGYPILHAGRALIVGRFLVVRLPPLPSNIRSCLLGGVST